MNSHKQIKPKSLWSLRRRIFKSCKKIIWLIVLISNIYNTHQVSSSQKNLYQYDLRWLLDDLRWPWKYHQKICLEKLIIPTKFHTTFKTNRTQKSTKNMQMSYLICILCDVFECNSFQVWGRYGPFPSQNSITIWRTILEKMCLIKKQ